jgi:predicted glutamine amidotransferase
MCIIVCKPAGVELPGRKILKNCFDANRDGAGIAYTKNGRVVIDKGLMSFDSFELSLDKITRAIDTKAEAMVLHFRIGTQGKNNRANCHPFVVSSDMGQIEATHAVTNMACAHNGIIRLTSFSHKDDSAYSDTMIFIRDYLSLIVDNPKKIESEQTRLLIERLIDSKMAFLSFDKKIHTIGSFINDGGVLYSNSTYQDGGYYSYLYGDRYSYFTAKIMLIESSFYVFDQNSAEYERYMGYSFGIDRDYNLYGYDYTTDSAYFIGKYRSNEILDDMFIPIVYDDALAERICTDDYFFEAPKKGKKKASAGKEKA